MSERKGIEIDYCPECRGVWLDRGELDKIIERSLESDQQARPSETAQRPNAPVEYYQQIPPSSGPYQKPYKRRKSFFEELFD